MNYKETLDYLFNALPMFHRIGPAAYKADLNNTIELCKLLNNPEKGLTCIHVAGTNGKGSVSHMLASIFQAAGYKTGLYTSPHLVNFTERIRINGIEADMDWIAGFVTEHQSDFERIKPSYFEMITAMAFNYFKEHQTDIAIIETGLGGRLDSTNVIMPEISVITNIGYDHMNLLGNSLQEIASEKAGIIKQNIPVVIGEVLPETETVFRKKAIEMGSELYSAQDHYQISVHNYNPASGKLNVTAIKLNSEENEVELECDLGGKYQVQNIRTVLTVSNLIKTKFGLTSGHIRNGISNVKINTGLRGRWEILSRKPLSICDTAHNSHGLETVIPMLNSIPYKTLHIVLGIVNDKDATAILGLFPKQAVYYFCKADIPRGLDAGELQKLASSAGLNGQVYKSVSEAYQSAFKNSHPEDVIFTGGSTFTVAEVLALNH